jgi:hypothetical protein
MLLRGIGAAGAEGHLHIVTRLFRGSFDSGAAAEHDQVRERHLLACRALNSFWMLLQHGKHFGELLGLFTSQSFMRCKTDAGTIGTTALVTATEGGGGSPGGGDELRQW